MTFYEKKKLRRPLANPLSLQENDYDMTMAVIWHELFVRFDRTRERSLENRDVSLVRFPFVWTSRDRNASDHPYYGTIDSILFSSFLLFILVV